MKQGYLIDESIENKLNISLSTGVCRKKYTRPQGAVCDGVFGFVFEEYAGLLASLNEKQPSIKEFIFSRKPSYLDVDYAFFKPDSESGKAMKSVYEMKSGWRINKNSIEKLKAIRERLDERTQVAPVDFFVITYEDKVTDKINNLTDRVSAIKIDELPAFELFKGSEISELVTNKELFKKYVDKDDAYALVDRIGVLTEAVGRKKVMNEVEYLTEDIL